MKLLNENNQFIIDVKVIKCPTEEQYRERTAEDLMANVQPIRALIDTGASRTCISQEHADRLELIPIGQSPITTAGDDCTVNDYLIHFAIPVAANALQPVNTNGEETYRQIIIGEERWVHVVQHRVHSIPSIGRDRGFDFILGMDILSKMHITMYGGSIILSF